MKTLLACLLLSVCTAVARANEIPGRYLLTAADGREKSFHVAAVYTTGLRVRDRENSEQLILRWDQLDEKKTFKRYPNLKAEKEKAGPVPAPLDGRKINITARWPESWSQAESTRKLTVTVRHMDPAAGGDAVPAKIEVYHVIHSGPTSARLLANAAPAIEPITLNLGGSVSRQIDLPVASRQKTIGGWAIRLWHEGRVVAAAESAPGMLAALPNATDEPRLKK